jgi:protocatechuate 3,4-dioxygenase beta subunit
MHLLLLAFLFNPQVSTPEPCALSGTVVDSLTGEPLNKVEIVLEPVGHETHIATTVSDAKGRFALVNLTPATYQMGARRNGYLDAETRVRMEAGQTLSGAPIKLVPSAVIAGTIRDNDGEPLEGAHVILARRTYRYGKPKVWGEDHTETDDRGEFRFRGLTAGRYYVGVEPKSRGWDRVDHSAGAGPPEISIAGFYPGVADISQAVPIDVAAGRRVTGIDIALPRQAVFHVRGRVVNGPAGRLTLALRDTKTEELGDYDFRTTTGNAEGEFEFRGVPAGSYELSASTATLTGRTAIVVSGADVDNARLTMAAGADVRLRVSAAPDEKPDLARLNYFLTANGRNGFSSPFQRDSPILHNVPPDHYALGLSGSLLKRYYVKSIRAGDIDVLADGLTIAGPGTVYVDIALASDGAAVEGLVRNGDSQPVAGATVVLAPEQRPKAMEFTSTTTDQNGRYEFTAVAPGKYKVFAWDTAEPEAWNDPDFLAQYEKQGEKAALEPKGRTVVDVLVAAKPDRP